MGVEIERKFLIKIEEWIKVQPVKSNYVKQAYLLSVPEKTIRVRITDGNGYLTIKGASVGISRKEFEYEIPLEDAHQLIDEFTTESIEKVRHIVIENNKVWEVDEFKGKNEGLFIAEIELDSETEQIAIPVWADKEVSADKRYSNSNLVINPYTTWNI